MPHRIEKLCIEKGLRMTEQRRVIARVLSESHDHPDAEELHRRAAGAQGRRQPRGAHALERLGPRLGRAILGNPGRERRIDLVFHQVSLHEPD